ncbi:MAG: HTTM domain-containing protein [Acidimicrobiales bacterium]
MGDWRPFLRHTWQALFEVDLRAIAAVRVGLGVVLLIDLARRFGDLGRWHGDDAIYPLDLAVADSGPTISIHLLTDSTAIHATLFVVAILAAVAMTIGWKTRVATVLSWALLVSLHQRYWLLQDLGDDLLVLTLFWVMLAPAGRRWSLDQRRAGTGGSPATICSVVSAGLLLQPAWIMFFAGLSKLRQPVWRDGSAVQVVLEDDIWARRLATVLLGLPWLLPWLSWMTVAVETIAPLALFVRRLRPLGLAALLSFVVGLGLSIQLGIIPWVMALALLPFLPVGIWDRVDQAIPRLAVGPGTESSGATESSEAAGAAAAGGRRPGEMFVGGIAALVLCFVLLANVRAVIPRLDLLPRSTDDVAAALRLEQGWSMYSPPGEGRYRVLVAMHFTDGPSRQLAIGSERSGWPTTESWPVLESLWADTRSRIYIYDSIAWPEMVGEHDALLAWLHRRWEAENPSSPVAELELVKVVRGPYGSEGPDGHRPIVERQSLAVLRTG